MMDLRFSKGSGDGRNSKSPFLTHVGEVVDEDDLLEKAWGRPVQDAVDGSQQDGPSLVVETHHHAGVRQHVTVLDVTAPAHTHTHTHTHTHADLVN